MTDLRLAGGTRGEARGGAACRFCNALLTSVFADLGMTPLSQTVIGPGAQHEPEIVYPLKAMVCGECFLVQLVDSVRQKTIFADYPYLSSYSTPRVDHATRYAHEMVDRLHLSRASHVVELGSNDGYLLRSFVELGIPSLGVEPAKNLAALAKSAGVPTIDEFFDLRLARRLVDGGLTADLIVANNVLTHTPDPNGFVAGMAHLLAPGGVITAEFPHLLRMIEESQFDAILHERYSYLSLKTAQLVFAAHGLTIFDAEELSNDGGSMRIYARSADDAPALTTRYMHATRAEASAGLDDLEPYTTFNRRAAATKRALLQFLIGAKARGATIAAYGTPQEGNTLLNFCGIGTDFVDFTVDRNPLNQGALLPGSRIPVYDPDHVFESRPDYLLILPWTRRDEVIREMAEIRTWGAQFVTPIPTVETHP